LQELPTPALLKAIADCGSSATAADVAAAAGLDISEARRQLLVLARLVGAELQVSDDGELLFVFDRPGTLRRSLRASSLRQRASDAWDGVSPPIFWLLRASFGIGLIASLAMVTTAIAVLTSSKDDSSSSSRSATSTIGGLWGPSPLDFLYYSTRSPYGYYPPSTEKGFLQSCFSLLFGDGDANLNLPQRTSAAAAAIIRANEGAVTAEQLAPLLAPPIDPEQAEVRRRPPDTARCAARPCVVAPAGRRPCWPSVRRQRVPAAAHAATRALLTSLRALLRARCCGHRRRRRAPAPPCARTGCCLSCFSSTASLWSLTRATLCTSSPS
jgi:hypothetical protein